ESSCRWLVPGPTTAAQTALVRASGGLWSSGEGRILRPKNFAIVPETPYLPPSTLAELLALPSDEAAQSAEVTRLLEPLGLRAISEHAGGLDQPVEWERVLSLRDQQLLSIARILGMRAGVVLLHEIGMTLDPEHVSHVLSLFSKAGIAVVMVDQNANTGGFDAVLDLELDGGWRLSH